MKFNIEKMKTYSPFLLIGGIVGFVVYLRRGNSSSPSSTSDSSATTEQVGTITNQLNSQVTDKINQLADNTNTVIASQTSYYDGLIQTLTEKIQSDESIISQNQQQVRDEINGLSQQLTSKTTTSNQQPIIYVTSPVGGNTTNNNDTSQLHNVPETDNATIYANTYNAVEKAMKNPTQENYNLARQSVINMKNNGVDMVAPNVSAVGEFSKQLDEVKNNNKLN